MGDFDSVVLKDSSSLETKNHFLSYSCHCRLRPRARSCIVSLCPCFLVVSFFLIIPSFTALCLPLSFVSFVAGQQDKITSLESILPDTRQYDFRYHPQGLSEA